MAPFCCFGCCFQQVTKVAVIPLIKTGLALTEERQKEEDTYLDLLHRALSSHHFYFSYNHDVTHTFQRFTRFSPQDKAKPLWQRADDRFFWNHDLVQELAVGKANDWVVPIMNAHVEYRPNCTAGNHRFHLLFVSRRSRYRQGCR